MLHIDLFPLLGKLTIINYHFRTEILFHNIFYPLHGKLPPGKDKIGKHIDIAIKSFRNTLSV